MWWYATYSYPLYIIVHIHIYILMTKPYNMFPQYDSGRIRFVFHTLWGLNNEFFVVVYLVGKITKDLAMLVLCLYSNHNANAVYGCTCIYVSLFLFFADIIDWRSKTLTETRTTQSNSIAALFFAARYCSPICIISYFVMLLKEHFWIDRTRSQKRRKSNVSICLYVAEASESRRSVAHLNQRFVNVDFGDRISEFDWLLFLWVKRCQSDKTMLSIRSHHRRARLGSCDWFISVYWSKQNQKYPIFKTRSERQF